MRLIDSARYRTREDTFHRVAAQVLEAKERGSLSHYLATVYGTGENVSLIDAFNEELANAQCLLLAEMIYLHAKTMDDPWELASSFLYLLNGELPTTAQLNELLESL